MSRSWNRSRSARYASRVGGYTLLSELARPFAVDPAAVRRRRQVQGLSLYAHSTDRRLRLVREDDIRTIFGISRAPQRTLNAVSEAEASCVSPTRAGKTGRPSRIRYECLTAG